MHYYEDDATTNGTATATANSVSYDPFLFIFYLYFTLYISQQQQQMCFVLFCYFSLYLITSCLCCAATTMQLFLPFKIFSALRVVFFIRSSNY